MPEATYMFLMIEIKSTGQQQKCRYMSVYILSFTLRAVATEGQIFEFIYKHHAFGSHISWKQFKISRMNTRVKFISIFPDF
jgi:hypothetical protein